MFVLKSTSKTNKDKSTEIFPLLLCMAYVWHVQCQEPTKGQQKVQILKKTTLLCPSTGIITLWYYLLKQLRTLKATLEFGPNLTTTRFGAPPPPVKCGCV